ncbi:MAG TPA: porin family protein [Puia sp.]|jgi:hypothetical protein|nr:porin family protein [Puia sp.]
MKKLVLLFIAGFSLATSHAQIRFGLKAGVNFSSLHETSTTDGSSLSTKVDFNAGALVNIKLIDKLSLQPEVIYSGQGSKATQNGMDATYNFGYINIPILVKYNIIAGLFAETGPQLGILTSANVKESGSSVSIKDEIKSTDWSWSFGAGYLLPINLGFDARYNLGFSNIAKGTDSNGGSLKNGAFQVGVFYLFGGGKK